MLDLCRAKLQELIDGTTGFNDADEEVDGCDLVDFIGEFRPTAIAALATPDPVVKLVERLQTLIDVAGQSVELSDWPELQKALEEGRAVLEELP
ncbi:hypothetical protein [Cupriavidus campinensis]|uniref:Uncharacterized protein n=1 Tax=Cupriavidus campinensis TaxID=151783 RepID=A0ABY3ESW7_9BURK|nr:hypothetical protein [Cupriavidus campinensis]TSP14057.1 hypothetical protein FGG12_06195 [Cupriavidus campinensis]